jgi:hypothetical protein
MKKNEFKTLKSNCRGLVSTNTLISTTRDTPTFIADAEVILEINCS